MWRIRDVYPGSRIRLFSIPDPGSDFFPSRIPDPNCLHPKPGSRIRIKEFKCFNPRKRFLSSRKYDPGCSSRIPDPNDGDFYPSRIPDPGVKKALVPDLDPQLWYKQKIGNRGKNSLLY
jgi:hypothetical protein